MKTREVMPFTLVFVSIPDPRNSRQVRHDLSELLTVAVCAVLCSADEFTDIEAWATERVDWLRGFCQATSSATRTNRRCAPASPRTTSPSSATS